MDPKQAYLYARKGKILHENGEFESAIQAYNKSMELESNNFLLYKSIAVSYSCMNKHDNALDAYKKAVSNDLNESFNADTYFKIGQIYHERNNFKEAIAYFNKAIQTDPFNANFHFNKAESLKGLKRYEEAINSFTSAVNIKPDFTEAKKRKAILSQKLMSIRKDEQFTVKRIKCENFE